jgi:hypothetical protein
VVALTGDSTIFGRIAKLTSKRHINQTALQKEIQRLVMINIYAALVISVIVIIVWAGWLRRDHPAFLSASGLIVAIVSVSVALIPEGSFPSNFLTRRSPYRCDRFFDVVGKGFEETKGLMQKLVHS